MMSIDRLETNIEKTTERIRNLAFQFHDSSAETEAENAKNEAVASLENYLELASQDWENRPQKEEEPEN